MVHLIIPLFQSQLNLPLYYDVHFVAKIMLVYDNFIYNWYFYSQIICYELLNKIICVLEQSAIGNDIAVQVVIDHVLQIWRYLAHEYLVFLWWLWCLSLFGDILVNEVLYFQRELIIEHDSVCCCLTFFEQTFGQMAFHYDCDLAENIVEKKGAEIVAGDEEYSLDVSHGVYVVADENEEAVVDGLDVHRTQIVFVEWQWITKRTCWWCPYSSIFRQILILDVSILIVVNLIILQYN